MNHHFEIQIDDILFTVDLLSDGRFLFRKKDGKLSIWSTEIEEGINPYLANLTAHQKELSANFMLYKKALNKVQGLKMFL